MTEAEKMKAGLFYDPSDAELTDKRRKAKQLCDEINTDAQALDRKEKLSTLFFQMGTECEVLSPFFCDYGKNITLGDHVFFNHNCILLDCAQIFIGNHVQIGPGCGLYTAIHPKDAVTRRNGAERALPITIEDDVWLGGSVTILPGVTIGARTIIGGGSVVTKDIPADCMAAGNPCRVLRYLDQSEREEISHD